MPALTIPSTNNVSISGGSNNYQISSKSHYHVSSSVNKQQQQQYNHHSMIPSSPMEHNKNFVNTSSPATGPLRVDTRQAAMIHLRSSSSSTVPTTNNSASKSNVGTKVGVNNVLASSTSGTRAARLKNALSPTSANNPETIEDIQHKLKQNLSRYTQAGYVLCRDDSTFFFLQTFPFDQNSLVFS